MFILISSIVLIGLAVVLYQLSFGEYRRAINKIPGPEALPLIGNVHQLGSNPRDILLSLLKWWRQYGQDKFRIWVGLNANIYVSHPKDVEAILTSTRILRKSRIYNLLHPWLGQGLLTSYGSLWHSHRKIITPSFHFKILVDFLDVMNKNSTKFVEILQKESRNSSFIDFQKVVLYLTLDVICETAMGVSINAMENNDSNLVKAFQYMCFSVQMRAFSAWKQNPYLFKFAPEYKVYKNALGTLKDFTMDIISKRRETMHNDTKIEAETESADEKINIRPKHAFLDTLLTATIEGQPLSMHEIYEEVSTFMFEGHDTTTSGISFVVYLLSRHQDVQEKVFQEQMNIFNGDLSRSASYSDIQDMKYLDMVIKETLRMYPSVPLIGRNTEKPFDLNGTLIPKNTMINILIISMGYNEKYFPDPYKFDPERFDPEVREKPNPFDYVPFSAGLRNCIGQKFALIEMKSVVAKIVRTFKILPPKDGLESTDGYEPKEPANEYDLVLSSVLTLKSENGILIRLKERNCQITVQLHQN